MDEIDQETKRILLTISEEQWRGYFDELKIYAEMRLARWRWRTGNRENLPRGYSRDAIVTEAVNRLYDGRRKWNHQYYLGDNPVPFLKGVIDSIISEIGRSSAHKSSVSLEDVSTAQGKDGGTYEREVEAAEGAAGFRPPPNLSPEQRAYLEEIDRRIEQAIKGRADLVKYYRHACKGLSTAEIAEAMNIDEASVRVLRRLFLRRTKKIRDELFG